MAIAFRHLVTGPDGETRIAGRRLTAYDIMCQHELGSTPEYIADNYDLTLAQVYEALAYALEHEDEMARIQAADDAAHRRVIDQMPEQVRELARAASAKARSVKAQPRDSAVP